MSANFANAGNILSSINFFSKVQIMPLLQGREFLRVSEHASSCKNIASMSKQALV